MVTVAVFSCLLVGQSFNTPLPKYERQIFAGIQSLSRSKLRKFTTNGIQLRIVSNVYDDNDAIFAKRFSNAQLERLSAVRIDAEMLAPSTPYFPWRAKMKHFSAATEASDFWHPTLTKKRDEGRLVAKIASGSFYVFDLKYSKKSLPQLTKLVIVDHYKRWYETWQNLDTEH